jgi:glyoxylate reductase
LPVDWLKPLDGRVRLIVGPADPPGFADHLLQALPEAEGLLTLLTDRVDAAILDRAPHVRVISNVAVGFDNIDIAECSARKIPVGNTPGAMVEATADIAMGLLIASARRFAEASSDAREGHWKTWSPIGWLGADISGAVIGIIGMGKIGKAMARRAHGFGMKIIYADTSSQPEIESSLGAIRYPLDDLLRVSDYISLHIPLMNSTRGLINESTLRTMKPSAIVINTSRGPIVNTTDLCRALREGWIAAAGLDVTDPEPLPPDHDLYDLPNCFILPHIGSATHGARRRMAEMACENVLAGLEGKRLPYCVNPQVYET